ncbi:MAG TPA: DNRLRE domain-containing protein, partial [Caldilineae bacterium]|nr:DNRLRE domain-containing protein [Caldilineae bacterium]
MKRQLLVVFLFVIALLSVTGSGLAREGAPARTEAGASTTTLYATADAWVDAAAPDTNYGTYDQLSAGQINHRYRNILVLFDLSSVPRGSHIDAAYLELYEIVNLQAAGIDARDDVLNLHASRLDADWSETRVTWNNQPAATALGDPPTNVYEGELWKRIDVTRIMRSLISNGDRNFGILVS